MQQDASMEAAGLVAAAAPMDRQLTVQEVSNAMAGPVAAAAGKQDGPATLSQLPTQQEVCIPFVAPLLQRTCRHLAHQHPTVHEHRGPDHAGPQLRARNVSEADSAQ